MGYSFECQKNCCPSSIDNQILEQKSIKEQSDEVLDTCSKINTGRKPILIRMVSSYNHQNNYLNYLNNVIHIQQSFRKYYSSSRSKQNLNTKSNEGQEAEQNTKPKESLLLGNYSAIPKVKPIKKVSFMNSIENENPMNTYALLAQTMFSTTLTIHPDGSIIDDNYRGYFLKKKDIKYQYKGYHTKGKKEGFGIIHWNDKSKFIGIFTNNQACSIGSFKDQINGDFNGYYESNKPNGFGIYFQNGKISEGYWTGNCLNGYCRQYSDDDTYYQGELKNSMKNGIGLFRWGDGSIYNGEWKNDKMNGYGILSFSDDRFYAGEWKGSKMHGYGEYDWLKGKKYFGNYQNDKKDGFGTYRISKKPLVAYIGFWKNGIYNGLGIEIKNKQFKYGIWTKGKRTQKFKGKWEISQHLTHNQLNYLKFFELPEEEIIAFILQN